MKNNLYIKICCVLILFFIIILPIFGCLKGLSSINYSSTTIKEESLATISTTSESYQSTTIIENTTMQHIQFTIASIKKETSLTAIPQKIESTTIFNQAIPSTTISYSKKESTTKKEEETTIEITSYKYINNNEYPNATVVWNYLRECGYNRAVCAGILGNMMGEVGGNTLVLDPTIYGGNYYGLCQWYLGYYPEIAGADIYSQLNFLTSTMRKEIDMFGYKYYDGFNYNDFLKITDAGEAAKAFAMCYERGAAWTYQARINNAYIAYDYFT